METLLKNIVESSLELAQKALKESEIENKETTRIGKPNWERILKGVAKVLEGIADIIGGLKGDG